MVWEEIKKTFNRWTFLVLFILFAIHIIMCAREYADRETFYEDYYEMFGEFQGPLDEEKVKEIEKVIEDTQGLMAREMEESIDYVMLDRENRDFVIQYGWEPLLLRSGTDYLLIFALIIIAAIVFSSECNNDMMLLLMSSKEGRKKQWVRIGGVLLLTGVTSIIYYLIKCGFIIKEYKLTGWDLSAKSLSFCAYYPYDFSLLEVTLITYGCKVLGCIYVVLITMFILQLTKKIHLASLVPVAILVVLERVFEEQEYLLIPLPRALFSSGINLKHMRAADYGKRYLDTSGIAVRPDEFEMVIAFSILFMMVLIVGTYFAYINNYKKNWRCRIWRKIKKS